MVNFGKYQLVKKLASGGMGEVFLARAEGAGKLLVLKRILPHLAEDKEFLGLFLDEARIAAQLNHANVVQILELGDVSGAWYLLMEYVAGRDLRQVSEAVRRRRRKVPLELACRIAADAAAGLDYAHRATDSRGRPMQIVHLDVSPHNVLVSFEGEVKLIDFGVAKAAGRLPQPAAGMLQGKYPYMSPEQVNGGELDHRSDQFSLGVVLWELLSGQRLFKGEDDVQTLMRVTECAVEPPSRKEEAVPRALVEIVMRALQKEPGHRFPDLAAFRLELEEVVIAQQWDASKARLAGFLDRLFPREAQESTHSAESVGTKTESEDSPGSKGGGDAKTEGGAESDPKSKVAGAESNLESRGGTVASPSSKARRRGRASGELVAPLPPVTAPMTSMIGRASELAELRQLLEQGERLVTVLGPDGAGKTRLATQLALDAPKAALAELTEAADLEGICAAVARALDLTLREGATAEEAVAQLGGSLAQRLGLLLVLDHFEPAIRLGSDAVGKWRAAAPDVSWVITSREGLKLPGERSWELPPLAEGLELFVERARASRPGWTPSGAEEKSLAELIDRLDGMPLAIELAAARSASFSPAQLVEQLPRRADRNATLEGAIAWSWGLLEKHEQLALAQLSLLRGGFSIEAAEAVISLSAFPNAPWALDVLQALRDRGLVRSWEAAGAAGELRFGFSESIRAYALEKLTSFGPDVLSPR